MKKIVIIGGCGYIGSKLFIHLLEQGYSVDTVDIELFGNFVNRKNIKYDYKDLPKGFFNKYNIIILLAGHSTVGMCEKDIIGSLKNNIENFVELMLKLKKQKFIYASTYRLYCDIGNRLAKETDSFRDPLSIYDLTKRTIDSYVSFSSIEFYSLRMATVNGYSPNLRANQVINKLFLSAKKGKEITMHNPYSAFSVLGINDLCRAIEQIIIGNDKRGIYNIGSFDTNINLITKEVTDVFKGINISIQKSLNRANHMRIDTSKFQKAYNFKFRDDLESILISLMQNFSQKTHIIKSI